MAKNWKYALPVLMPKSLKNEDIEKHYAAVKKHLSPNPIKSLDQGRLEITLKKDAPADLYSIFGGSPILVLKNQNFRGYTPNVPTLVLLTWDRFIERFAKGLNPPEALKKGTPFRPFVAYENVDLASVRKLAEVECDRFIKNIKIPTFRGHMEVIGLKRLLPKNKTDYNAHLKAGVDAFMRGVLSQSGPLSASTFYLGIGASLGKFAASSSTAKKLTIRFGIVLPKQKKVVFVKDPLLLLRYLLGEEQRLADHPLAASIKAQPTTLKAWAKFVYRDAQRRDHGLANRKVQMLAMGSAVVTEKPTDHEGCVQLEVPTTTAANLLNEAVYFKILFDTSQKILGVTPPAYWDSYGAKDIKNRPGSYDKFPGLWMGSKTDPLTFRVYDNVPIQIAYTGTALGPPRPNPAPPCVKVTVSEIMHAKYLKSVLRSLDLQTNNDGRVFYPVLNTPEPLMVREVYLQADMQDHFVSARVEGKGTVGVREYKGLIGEKQIIPKKDLVRGNARMITRHALARDALYTLKTVREIAYWLDQMTTGANPAWQAPYLKVTFLGPTVDDASALTPKRSSDGKLQYEIELGGKYVRSRPTIAHEYGHVFVDKMCGVTETNIKAATGNEKYISPHYHNMVSGYAQALFEGWAQFAGALFGDHEDAYKMFVRRNLPLRPPSMLLSANFNLGYRVEGVISSLLWQVYTELVLGRPSMNAAVNYANNRVPESIPESINGSSISIPHYSDAARERFIRLIWEPMTELGKHTWSMDTRKFIRYMCNRATPAERQRIVRMLLHYYVNTIHQIRRLPP